MPRSSSKTANPKPNDNGDKRKQEKMRAEWATLGKEYDVVAPARSVAGHLTRKVPKAQWKARTRKRKLLEQADEEAAAIDFEEQPRQRLRGSRFAIEDQLIQESLVFPSSRRQALTPSDDDEEEEEQQQQQPITQQEDEVEEDDGEEDQSNEDAVDDIEGEEDEQDDVEGENEDLDGGDDEGDLHEEHVSEVTASGRKKVSDRTPKLKKRKMAPKSSARRRMYRLRNFQSQRLAQRHGDALAAHARGQPREAIQLLKEVAKDAPSAPQIYSSLGMVYEDMLKESRKRSIEENDKVLGEQSQAATVTIPIFDQPSDVIANADESIPDPSLAEQLDLAKKAYGSYHIAAILCKKDFMLWLRAADAGSEVVHILGQAMLLPTLDLTVVAYHRSEKRRWQSEVLRDLQAADSLKPPGIDVPCKLAAMHIELGNLSEALTILTDLKNHQIPASQGRSEFQSSYKAWLLYADLMLRVGHECIQWNRGNRFNDNYMFRRWLRKYSQVFDWQERRLQALCLALEAAAGTKSTGRFIQWMRNRAYDNCVQNIDGEKGAAAAAEEEETDKDDDNANEQLESERQMLLAKHRSEMEAFDKSTNDLELALNSAAAKDRKSNRDDLLKSQEDAVATLDKEYGGDEKQAIVEKKHDEMMADFHDSVPIAASCRQVCKIASELMKHLHGLEMYPGARLVGETVSNYLKERAAKNDRRRMASKRVEQWQQKMSQASFLFASYEEVSHRRPSHTFPSTSYILHSSLLRKVRMTTATMECPLDSYLMTRILIVRNATNSLFLFAKVSCHPNSGFYTVLR